MSRATVLAAGTKSRRSPTRFAPSRTFVIAMPVTLAPGRLKLMTRPSRTGSVPVKNTIGISDVAAFNQPQDRQGTWHRSTAVFPAARRRGDRMSNCVVGSGGSRLPCSTIAEHGVEGCDHFSHDGDDDDL